MFKKWSERRKARKAQESLKKAIATKRRRLNRTSWVLFSRQDRIRVLGSKLAVLLPAVRQHKETAIEELEKLEPDIKKLNRAEAGFADALYEFEQGLKEWRKYRKSEARYAGARHNGAETGEEDFMVKILKAAIETAKFDLTWIRKERRNREL